MEIVINDATCIIMQETVFPLLFNSGQATDLNLFVSKYRRGLRSVLFAAVSSTTFRLVEPSIVTDMINYTCV